MSTCSASARCITTTRVSVGDDDIARHDHNPGDGDGLLEWPRSELVRPRPVSPARANTGIPHSARASASRTAPSMTKPPTPSALARIPIRSTIDSARDTVAVPVDHDDVAGFGDVQGVVDVEVVAGPGPDRQRGAGQPCPWPTRGQPRGDAETFLGISNIGRGHAGEPLDDGVVDGGHRHPFDCSSSAMIGLITVSLSIQIFSTSAL